MPEKRWLSLTHPPATTALNGAVRAGTLSISLLSSLATGEYNLCTLFWISRFFAGYAARVVNFICRADKIIPDIYYSWFQPSLRPGLHAQHQISTDDYFHFEIGNMKSLQDWIVYMLPIEFLYLPIPFWHFLAKSMQNNSKSWMVALSCYWSLTKCSRSLKSARKLSITDSVISKHKQFR